MLDKVIRMNYNNLCHRFNIIYPDVCRSNIFLAYIVCIESHKIPSLANN